MSATDLATVTVLIVVPLIVAARELVRLRRGEPFDRPESLVVTGAVGWGVAGLAIYSAGWTRDVLAPVILALLGTYLVAASRLLRPPGRQQGRRWVAAAGGLALAAGLMGIIAMAARLAGV